MNGPPNGNARVKHLVIAIHGILTAAHWKDEVRDAIEHDEFGERDEEVKFELAGYGILDLPRFIFPFLFAPKIVDRVHGKIRGFHDEYPNADISVIAHSFGTYVIAKILQQQSLRLLILFASVIPADTALWSSIRKSVVDKTRNDCSRRDKWPGLAYAIWSYGNTGNIGAQTYGVEDVFHATSDHSALLTNESAAKYWRPFLIDGTVVRPAADPNRVDAGSYNSHVPVVLRLVQVAFGLLLIVLLAARRSPPAEIRSGTVGVFGSWTYFLDTDEAVISVQTSKDTSVVDKYYVIVVLKEPRDGIPLEDDARTVVSKVHRGLQAEAQPETVRLRCGRISDSINYEDSVRFYLFIVDDDKVERLQTAIGKQETNPLTIRQITDLYGGIKKGSGGDGAVFDKHGELIQCTLRDFEKMRKGEKAARGDEM
jgi:hypothetical protein